MLLAVQVFFSPALCNASSVSICSCFSSSVARITSSGITVTCSYTLDTYLKLEGIKKE